MRATRVGLRKAPIGGLDAGVCLIPDSGCLIPDSQRIPSPGDDDQLSSNFCIR